MYCSTVAVYGSFNTTILCSIVVVKYLLHVVYTITKTHWKVLFYSINGYSSTNQSMESSTFQGVLIHSRYTT